MNNQEKQNENKELGMKWFNFYFSWRIYFSLVVSILGLAFSMSLIFSELNLFLGSAIFFDLLNIALATILLVGFRKKRAWLYRYNISVLILEWLNISSRSFTPDDVALIWFGVGFLWFFFNYRYFKKRKSFMFYEKNNINIDPKQEKNPGLFLKINNFIKFHGIVIGIIMVILFAGFIYLKEYRLNYCQTKYSQNIRRVGCLDTPLYKFIFR